MIVTPQLNVNQDIWTSHVNKIQLILITSAVAVFMVWLSISQDRIINIPFSMFMFFMARRAIPMIAFHGVESIYIFFVCPLVRVCVVYVVKEVLSILRKQIEPFSENSFYFYSYKRLNSVPFE